MPCRLLVSVLLLGSAMLADAADSPIRSARFDCSESEIWRRVDLVLDLAVAPENPDDPGQVGVTGRFTGPDGAVVTMPGFFHRDFRVDEGGRRIVATGASDWRVRFLPPKAGVWTGVVTVKRGEQTWTSEPQTLTVVAGTLPGFIRIDPRNSRYLSRDGRSFFVHGANVFSRTQPIRSAVPESDIGPEGMTPELLYRTYRSHLQQIDAVKAVGGNTIRLRLDSWWLALEAPKLPLPGFPDGIPGFAEGRYHAAHAWIADRLIERCEAHGLGIQFCTWNPNVYLLWAGGMEQIAKASGRPFSKEERRRYHIYAKDPKNLGLAKRRLRYQVARWGASTSVALWEYFNEIGHGWNGTRGFDIHDEHWTAITAWLHALDPYARPVTNSREGVDTRDLHAYLEQEKEHFFTWVKKDEMKQPLAHFWEDETRPMILGEYGARGDNTTIAQKMNYMREGAWVALCSGKAGAMNWRAQKLFDGDRHIGNFAPLGAFIADLDPAAHDWREATITGAADTELLRCGITAGDRAMVYITRTPCSESRDRRALADVTLTVGPLDPGNYRASWWRVVGKPGVAGEVAVTVGEDGLARLPLPTGLTRDIALRIEKGESSP